MKTELKVLLGIAGEVSVKTNRKLVFHDTATRTFLTKRVIDAMQETFDAQTNSKHLTLTEALVASADIVFAITRDEIVIIKAEEKRPNDPTNKKQEIE